MTLYGTHDVVLVGISVLIAIMASFAALDLAARIRNSDDSAKRIWLATAALAMGGGIWAMHFAAMLAFKSPGMNMGYDVFLTMLSLVVAVLAAGISFWMMSCPSHIRPLVLGSAGLIMGLGMVSMHYIGMYAMEMPASVNYDRLWVVVSVMIAIGASTVALWLFSRSGGHIDRVGSALLMGFAISGMHFSGMQAAIFSTDNMASVSSPASVLNHSAIAIAVAVMTFMILAVALAASMFDRRMVVLAAREAAALRVNEERFRALYNGTPLPLNSLDREGCIEHASDAWLSLLGYPREEVIGRPFIDFLELSSAQVILLQDWPKLLAQGHVADLEHSLIRKDGKFVEVLISAKVERDINGRFMHVLVGLADVTGRKQIEEELRQSQKMETIGHLTGGVAHDFNNLLAVVIGNLDLVLKRMPEDPKVSRLIFNALEGAKRGATLTQRLLAFARRQNLRPQNVDVSDLVSGMADLLERSIGPLVEIETSFQPDLPKVLVDGHQLELAILNLAVNARDAMPEGGAFNICAREEIVSYDAELSPGKYVRIGFQDGGQGMDKDTLARATEPFFTSKGTGKGTGLGLSMVQGFAAQSGGKLSLESRFREGLLAEIWLPAALDISLEEVVEGQDAGPVKLLSAKSILVVDDDPLVLANTIAMLEDLGHAVIGAVSGAEAVELVDSGKLFDLVVTDYLMPGMNGLALAEALNQKNQKLPVLLVSGYAQLSPDDICDLPILAKPFDQGQLAGAMASILGS